MHTFLLFALFAPAFAGVLAPRGERYTEAQDSIVDAPWNSRTEGRIDDFSALWKQREDRKTSVLNPKPEVVLDRKLDLVEGHQLKKNRGKSNGSNKRMAPPPPPPPPQQQQQQQPETQDPSMCRSGAVPQGLRGANKYPNPQGFFKFTESVIGTKYSPAELETARERLTGSLEDHGQREKAKNSDSPPPSGQDNEFLKFAGLEAEEVAPTAKDVFQDEARRAGLGDFQQRPPAQRLYKRYADANGTLNGTVNGTNATTTTTTTIYLSPTGTPPGLLNLSAKTGNTETMMVLVEDIRRYIIFSKVADTAEILLTADAGTELEIDVKDPSEETRENLRGLERDTNVNRKVFDASINSGHEVPWCQPGYRETVDFLEALSMTA
jgi:hypothetical protein